MDAWFIAAEESLRADRRSSKPNNGLIHCVPKRDYEINDSKGRIESDESKGRTESDERKGRIVISICSFSENHESDERNPLPRIDSILSRNRHHPLLNDIVKDMFKMENQIPFGNLDKIRESLGVPAEDEGFIWFESSLKNLSPVEKPDGPGDLLGTGGETNNQINGYVKKWWKVLWAQFRMAHCSKPWTMGKNKRGTNEQREASKERQRERMKRLREGQPISTMGKNK
ncbi:hypothetical protein SUGI_0728500 [Cryptomeria japonica]|nr:hypothetical protein SUGI_0728500 [Cryptomeria japonica]